MMMKRRRCSIRGTVSVSFRTTKDVYDQLAAFADELVTSISHCVWLIVKEYFSVPEEV